MRDITIRPVADGDRAEWERLYRGYAEFYEVGITGEMADRIWGWLMDPGHEIEALVAASGEGLAGLAHFSQIASPLRAGHIGYLHDLFVAPRRRREGIGGALIGELHGIAAERGWALVRWITREGNATARSLYDKKAGLTDWKIYDLPRA